jgi:hypothetical protein
MFKVGDVLKIINGRRHDRYKVISIDIEGNMVLRNTHQSHSRMDFRANITDNLELDKFYYRKEKIEKIMDNIDSFNIMRHAKKTAELNRKIEWMYMMELRKRKIKQICSKLEIK